MAPRCFHPPPLLAKPALLDLNFARRGPLGDLLEPEFGRPAGGALVVVVEGRPRLRALGKDVAAVLADVVTRAAVVLGLLPEQVQSRRRRRRSSRSCDPRSDGSRTTERRRRRGGRRRRRRGHERQGRLVQERCNQYGEDDCNKQGGLRHGFRSVVFVGAARVD